MKNVTLVSFYGHKPQPLINLIQRLQTAIAEHHLVTGQFIPYQLEQVHATIIGCEGIITESGIISHWFHHQRQENKCIDFIGLINYLHHQLDFPLKIHFAGYQPAQEYNFLSREQHLYLRSFQLQASATQIIPVLIGWTWQGDRISLAIDNLRRNLQQFNLLHKYHGTSDAVDNDFYLRLGTITAKLTPAAAAVVATDIRNLLAAQSPIQIAMSQKDLAFAQYQDLLLTPATTKVIPLMEITPDRLEQLYFH